MHTACDKSRDMSDIGDEDRAHFVGNFTEFCKVENPRIGSCPCPKQLRFVLSRQTSHFVKIDTMIVTTNPVSYAVEVFSGDADFPAMSQMSSGRKTKTQHRISWLAEGKVDTQVRWATTVGLHIHMLSTKQLFHSGNRKIFNGVDHLLPLVVAFVRVTLRVLVGEDRPGGC